MKTRSTNYIICILIKVINAKCSLGIGRLQLTNQVLSEGGILVQAKHVIRFTKERSNYKTQCTYLGHLRYFCWANAIPTYRDHGARRSTVHLYSGFYSGFSYHNLISFNQVPNTHVGLEPYAYPDVSYHSDIYVT